MKSGRETVSITRPGLLEYLFLHKVLVPGLLGHNRVPHYLMDLFRRLGPVQIDEPDPVHRDKSHFTIIHVTDFAGMLHQGGHVRCDQAFSVAVPDDQRAFAPRAATSRSGRRR